MNWYAFAGGFVVGYLVIWAVGSWIRARRRAAEWNRHVERIEALFDRHDSHRGQS
jgi:uncharacterized membrane protein YciS (DUF1049 family)